MTYNNSANYSKHQQDNLLSPKTINASLNEFLPFFIPSILSLSSLLCKYLCIQVFAGFSRTLSRTVTKGNLQYKEQHWSIHSKLHWGGRWPGFSRSQFACQPVCWRPLEKNYHLTRGLFRSFWGHTSHRCLGGDTLMVAQFVSMMNYLCCTFSCDISVQSSTI